MRFLGQAEVSSFIEEHAQHAERVRAWVAEMQFRNWQNAQAMAMDFGGTDISSMPKVVFRLGQPLLIFETLVDFRRGIVLLTKIAVDLRVVPLVS